MIWHGLFSLINRSTLVAAIIIVAAAIIIGLSVGRSLDFSFIVPAAMAGMLMPVVFALCENSDLFLYNGNLITTVDVILEAVLLFLSLLNAPSTGGTVKGILLLVLMIFAYYTFGTVCGASVLYFTQDKTTFARVVWFLGFNIMIGMIGIAMMASPGGDKNGTNDQKRAKMGEFGPGPIVVVSDDGETMTVRDNYGNVFTYYFGEERWYDPYKQPADVDACGFNDAVKGANIREHIYNYRKNKQ